MGMHTGRVMAMVAQPSERIRAAAANVLAWQAGPPAMPWDPTSIGRYVAEQWRGYRRDRPSDWYGLSQEEATAAGVLAYETLEARRRDKRAAWAAGFTTGVV